MRTVTIQISNNNTQINYFITRSEDNLIPSIDSTGSHYMKKSMLYESFYLRYLKKNDRIFSFK